MCTVTADAINGRMRAGITRSDRARRPEDTAMLTHSRPTVRSLCSRVIVLS